MKYHEKLCDRGAKPGAKYLANLLAEKEYEILVSSFSSKESVVFLVKGVFLWW